jgi:hypothetical protein
MVKYKIDRKTGKRKLVNAKRSRIATKAARRRKGKHLKTAVKRKISMSLKKTERTHRTKFGRRVLKRKHVVKPSLRHVAVNSARPRVTVLKPNRGY